MYLKESDNLIIEGGGGKFRLGLLPVMTDVPCKAINPS